LPDAYPTKPIKVIVPFAAGATSDVLVRVIAERMVQRLKEPIIVENRTGAGGTVGVSAVVRASPDGYTLLATTSSPLTINPLIDKTVGYDVTRDLTPIAVLNNIALLLVSRPDFPPTTLSQLLTILRAKPGEYSFATNGIGSYSHMAMELFMKMTGTKLVHVPYKGAPQAENDLLGGQVTLMFDSVVTVSEFVRSGKLKSFGVSSLQPDRLQPGQKPIAQQGVADLASFDVVAFTGLLTPAKTSPEVVTALRNAVIDALRDPALRAAMVKRNTPLATEEEAGGMERRLVMDTQKWSALVKSAHIRLD
jgi:tripartite-type tricarboxylate transporter receptor subunit TctC